MQIIIGQTTFSALDALSFAPETDLSGDSIPINTFEAEIHTTASIGIGQWAELRDDVGGLWARYWITYAEHIDAQTLKIVAKAPTYLMSQVRLPAEVWSGKSAATAIAETMAGSLYGGTALAYTLDSAFDGATLTGFVPVQECRTRLQWVCYAIGAYVKTYFNDRIEILPIADPEQPTIIPLNRTYHKPSVTYNDHVTAITALSYTFTAGTPSTTDAYVEDSNGNAYIVAKQTNTLRNPDVPAGAPEHTVNIEEMYLINSANVDAILARLSDMYFKRTEIDLAVINNAEYMPGDRVMVYPDEQHIMDGYIGTCDFAFGVQAKASLHMVPVTGVDAALLTITYVYGDMQIDRQEYLLPLGYYYSITNPYYDMHMDGHRYIFRPDSPAAEGTIEATGNDVTVQYAIALDGDDQSHALTIISVDDLSMDAEGVVSIT